MTNAPPGAALSPQEAFRQYIEPEIEVMLRVGRTLTGSWPDAEDLVQDSLLRAWKAIDRFDGAHPRAWLLTILRNVHLNSHRRQRPDLAGDKVNLENARPAFGSTVAPSPEDTVTERILDTDLAAALATLDERFRTVLLLIDVDDLSYADVATLLDIPVGTVMSRLSRARDRVRTQLRGTRTSPAARAGGRNR